MQPLSSGHTCLLTEHSGTISQATFPRLLLVHLQAASGHFQNHCCLSLRASESSSF